jgi:uncharacterized protein YcbX
VIRVESLHIYPVKSCAGIEVARARVETAGLAHDREWMIVTPEGRFLTQRELPQLARIRPDLGPTTLVLRAPDQEELHIEREPAGPQVEVRIWQDHCRAMDCGDDAARWLHRCLGREVRLVHFPATERRRSNPQWTGTDAGFTRFADGFALLLICAASLEDLNARLETPLPMNRFRPNLVLSGVEPYGEDRLDELTDGAVRLRAVKPCVRCAIPTTDQATGVVAGQEPLATLKTYRWSPELHGITFGQNLIVLAGGELTVGQTLEASWRD